MKIAEIGSGDGYSLYALEINDKYPVKEYLETLDEKSLKQFLALFEHIYSQGPPTNERKFRRIFDKIYELKIYSGGRILCFIPDESLPKSLILTHGFPKPPKKTLQREAKRTNKYRSDFIEYVNKNKNIIVE